MSRLLRACLFFLLVVSAASSAGFAEDMIGQLPVSYVVTQIPPQFGNLWKAVPTSVAGLQILQTIPLMSDAAAWTAVENYYTPYVNNSMPSFPMTPLAADPSFDNREWAYFGLWEIGASNMTLYAAASLGKVAGVERVVIQLPPTTAVARQRVEEWRQTLMAVIAAQAWTDEETFRNEVDYYTGLTNDESVSAALVFASLYPGQADCSVYNPGRPGANQGACRNCCGSNKDICDGIVEGNTAWASAWGCGLVAIGCVATGAAAPAAIGCCSGGAAVTGGIVYALGNSRCKKQKGFCDRDCGF